jgi:hypothetical protein
LLQYIIYTVKVSEQSVKNTLIYTLDIIYLKLALVVVEPAFLDGTQIYRIHSLLHFCQGDTVEVKKVGGRKVYRCRANITMDKEKLMTALRYIHPKIYRLIYSVCLSVS